MEGEAAGLVGAEVQAEGVAEGGQLAGRAHGVFHREVGGELGVYDQDVFGGGVGLLDENAVVTRYPRLGLRNNPRVDCREHLKPYRSSNGVNLHSKPSIFDDPKLHLLLPTLNLILHLDSLPKFHHINITSLSLLLPFHKHSNSKRRDFLTLCR